MENGTESQSLTTAERGRGEKSRERWRERGREGHRENREKIYRDGGRQRDIVEQRARCIPRERARER